MVLQGKQRLGAETDQGWRSLGERGCLTIPPSQDGFSGIEDDADEALEISQAQLLFESRHKGQQPPPPSNETKSRPPPCQGEAAKEVGAPKGSEVAPGPGEEERDGSSDRESSSEDEER